MHCQNWHFPALDYQAKEFSSKNPTQTNHTVAHCIEAKKQVLTQMASLHSDGVANSVPKVDQSNLCCRLLLKYLKGRFKLGLLGLTQCRFQGIHRYLHSLWYKSYSFLISMITVFQLVPDIPAYLTFLSAWQNRKLEMTFIRLLGCTLSIKRITNCNKWSFWQWSSSIGAIFLNPPSSQILLWMTMEVPAQLLWTKADTWIHRKNLHSKVWMLIGVYNLQLRKQLSSQKTKWKEVCIMEWWFDWEMHRNACFV